MYRRSTIVLLPLVIGCLSCPATNEGGAVKLGEICEQSPTWFLPSQGPAEHLLVMDTTQLDTADRLLLLTLQGNVNRTKPRIYAINGPQDGQVRWLEDYKTMYGITYETAPGLMDMVSSFSADYAGVIINDPGFLHSINLATTLAGIHGALVVYPKHLDHPAIASLPVIEDLRGTWDDENAMYDWMMKELWPKVNQSTIAALHPGTIDGWLGDGGADLRDYVVANRILAFYRSPVKEEKAKLEQIMDAIPDNLPVIGYLSVDGAEEIKAQIVLNERNKWLIPTHNTQNLSVHSGVPADIPSLRNLVRTNKPKPALGLEEIKSQLVVTAALTDYDNYQVPLHVGRKYWDQASRGRLPIAWGIPGTALRLAPGMVEYFYRTKTPNDSFMLPTSLGYFTPSLYQDIDWIAAETTKTMCMLGLDVMYPLDSINGMVEFTEAYRESLAPFSHQFNMRGFFLNYFANDEKCCVSGQAGVPWCYTSTSYNEIKGTVTEQIQHALAQRKAGEPSFLFLGLNGWHYNPDQIVAEFEALSAEDTAKVKWVTQDQFFEAVRLAYQDEGYACPEKEVMPYQPVEVPCEDGDEIDLSLPKTSVILDLMDGDFKRPEVLGTLLKKLIDKGMIPPLLFGYQNMSYDRIEVLGAFAVDANPPIQQNMKIPSFDIPNLASFRCNPYIVLGLEHIKVEISGFGLNIQNLQITGKLDPDANFTEGTLSGIIDPVPLQAELGLDPCKLGQDVCNADGLIEVLIGDLAGQGIELQLVRVSDSNSGG